MPRRGGREDRGWFFWLGWLCHGALPSAAGPVPRRPTRKTRHGLLACTLRADLQSTPPCATTVVGAEGAVTARKRDMLAARASASTVNQALAAVTLMYEQAGLRIAVRRDFSFRCYISPASPLSAA